MKNFERNNLMFSLCGLNCALCVMKLDHYCPGCGGGAGNQGCAIAKCSLTHGGLEYCFQCEDYPCQKYNDIEAFDSFITHRNQLKDMEKAQRIGIKQYNSELEEKADILQHLLANYNDGRRKGFFCIAVNLLELKEIKDVVEQITIKTSSDSLSIKEKAAIAAGLFQSMAEQRSIVLKLIKKPAKKPSLCKKNEQFSCNHSILSNPEI